MKKIRGFTLVELLVVMAIIGVLAAIVMVNLTESQKKSRDAKRKADLNTILTAMMLYYDDHNTFSLAGCECGSSGTGRGWFNLDNDDSYPKSIAQYLLDEKYLSSIVIDSSGKTLCTQGAGGSCDTEPGGPYMFYFDSTKKVTVYAKMESTKSTVDVNNSCNATPAISPAQLSYCTSYYRNYSLTTTK